MKARTITLWKKETQKTKIRPEALEGAKRLELWFRERGGKAVFETVKAAKNRLIALGKVMRLREKREILGDFAQWKRKNRTKRREKTLWKSAFSELSKFARRKQKSALGNRLNCWKEATFHQKISTEDRLVEGGMRLAVVCSLQGKAAALNGLKTAFQRDKGGKWIRRLWIEREKAGIRGKIRQWRRKTESKSLFAKGQKAVKMLKFAISVSVARKVEKSAIFRKFATLPFPAHKKALNFRPKVSIQSNSLLISHFQPLSKPLFSPFILRELQDSEANLPLFSTEKLSVKSALLALASHARQKPAEMIRKWRNAVKTDISELNFRFRLYDRLGKVSQKRGLRHYFAVWKRENYKNRLQICFRRIASYSHFAVARSFSVWRTRQASERSRVVALGLKFQRQLLALVAQKALPSLAPAHTRVRLQFLALLLGKRVAGSFAVWKTHTNCRNLQEVRAVSQIQGVRHFLTTMKSRNLAGSFARYSHKARLKGRISRFLHTFLRKNHQFRMKTALSAWKGLISTYHLRSRAIQHLQSLLNCRLAAHFRALALCPAAETRELDIEALETD